MKTRGTSSMKKVCCSLVRGGKAITFGFGSAKHSSPIECDVQIGQNVPVSACQGGAGRYRGES